VKNLVYVMLTAAVLFATGCNRAAMRAGLNESADRGRVQARKSVATNQPSTQFRLGAGDATGRQVFAHAVQLARASNPRGNWAYANSRAVLPAFAARPASKVQPANLGANFAARPAQRQSPATPVIPSDDALLNELALLPDQSPLHWFGVEMFGTLN
jgi:hypothetical protein